jgi:hypothetical protein
MMMEPIKLVWPATIHVQHVMVTPILTASHVQLQHHFREFQLLQIINACVIQGNLKFNKIKKSPYFSKNNLFLNALQFLR